MQPKSPRKSYGQYCGLARALDTVGDRWTLLIVRELMIGPRRFGELLVGLPHIASNLLTDRLRHMEDDGLVTRTLAEPGAGLRYALSTKGEALRDVVGSLIRWSTPLMTSGRGGQLARGSWLCVALPALLSARPRPAVSLLIVACGDALSLHAGPSGVRATLGRTRPVHAELTAEPEVVLGLATGMLSLRAARQLGSKVTGDASALTRVFEPHTGTSHTR